MDAVPHSPREERAEKLHRPGVRQQLEDLGGVKLPGVVVQQVHSSHSQLMGRGACAEVHGKQCVEEALTAGCVLTLGAPQAVVFSGREVPHLMHQDVQGLLMLTQLPVEDGAFHGQAGTLDLLCQTKLALSNRLGWLAALTCLFLQP